MSFFHGNEKNPKSGNCISNIPFLLSTNQLRRIPSNPFVAQLCSVNLVKNKTKKACGQNWSCQEHWHTTFPQFPYIMTCKNSIWGTCFLWNIFMEGQSESNMTARKTLVINIFIWLKCQLLLRIQSQEYSRGILNMKTSSLVVMWVSIVCKEREKDVEEIVVWNQTLIFVVSCVFSGTVVIYNTLWIMSRKI
jgi:hypothetical protein